MAQIVIFGTGDLARLAHHYFSTDSPHEVVAFTVDGQYRNGSTFLGLPLLDVERVAERHPPEDHKMFVAIGYSKVNRVRADKYAAAKALGFELVSYVSSRCSFLTQNAIGDNCFIMEDNTVQPFVTIGSDVILWSGNHVGHDSVIEDHCFVTSHVVISGHVRVGAYSFLGVNATLRNGITIGSRSVVGAGAIVMKDTADASVYLARPASLYEKSSEDVEL